MRGLHFLYWFAYIRYLNKTEILDEMLGLDISIFVYLFILFVYLFIYKMLILKLMYKGIRKQILLITDKCRED